MTIQWIGSEADAAQRPVWYAKKGSQVWRTQGYSTRRFPMTDHWIFRAELTGLEPDTELRFPHWHRFRGTEFPHDAGQGHEYHPIRVRRRQRRRAASAAHEQTGRVQAPAFVILGGDLAYENGDDPIRFLEFLENYSSDLRDGQRASSLGGLHRKSRSRRRIRETANAGSVFLLGVRRLVPRNRLRGFGFWPIHVAGVSRHEPHLADRRRTDRLARADAERAPGLPECVRGQSRAGVSVASSISRQCG